MANSILVLHNVAKKKNFGDLIRTAAAMGVDEIVIVGAAKLATFGAQGCSSHMQWRPKQRSEPSPSDNEHSCGRPS